MATTNTDKITEETHSLVFHGTTDVALKSIFKKGCVLSSTSEKVWNPSRDEVYFWYPEYLMECECLDDLDAANSYAYNNSISNALCSYAVNREARGIAVISFWVKNKDIQADDSCPNMGGAGFVDYDVDLNDYLESIKVSTNENLEFFRPYIAGTIKNNPLLNFWPYSYEENQMIDAILENGMFFDEFSEICKMENLHTDIIGNF